MKKIVLLLFAIAVILAVVGCAPGHVKKPERRLLPTEKEAVPLEEKKIEAMQREEKQKEEILRERGETTSKEKEILPVKQKEEIKLEVIPTPPSPQQAPCTDSDGGVNPNVAGTAQGTSVTIVDCCWDPNTNQCTTTGTILREAYCTTQLGPQTQMIPCRCENGMCTQIAIPPAPQQTAYDFADYKETNQLTFTFTSTEHPWGAQELENIKNLLYGVDDGVNDSLDGVYEYVRSVMGPPARNQVVNVREDPAITTGGQYNPATSEIILKGVAAGGVTAPGDIERALVHETVHAFIGNLLPFKDAYLEGLHKAVENIVMEKLGLPSEQRVFAFYDLWNKPQLNPPAGRFFTGMQITAGQRYELASTIFRKAWIEDPSFFQKLNKAYYQKFSQNPAVRADLAALNSVFSQVKPTLESESTITYLGKQHAFSPDAPPGKFVVLGLLYPQAVVYFFERSSAGGEQQPFSGASTECAEARELEQQGRFTATIRYYDDAGNLIHEGEMKCSGIDIMGIIKDGFFYETPAGEQGRMLDLSGQRIKAVADIRMDDKHYSDEMFFTIRGHPVFTGNIFGVVMPPYETGSITVTSLDNPQLSYTTQVEKGAFDFSQQTLRDTGGMFKIEFTPPNGSKITRTITKLANSAQFVVLG